MADCDVAIVGGGISGLATAVGLLQRGVSRVHVFEKAHEYKPVGAAIGLFPNGFAALEALSPNVHRRVREACIAHDISHNYDLNNELVRTIDFSQMNMVSPSYLVWYLLQKYLMEEFLALAETTGNHAKIYMGHALEVFSFDDDNSGWVTLHLHNRTTQCALITASRVLVGADGVHSFVRSKLFPNAPKELHYHDKVMFRAVLPVSELVLQNNDKDENDTGTGEKEEISTNLCPPLGVAVSYSGDEKGKLFAFRETSPGIASFTAMAAYPKEPPSIGDSNEERKQFVVDKFQNYPKPVLQVLERVSASSVLINPVYSISVLEEWSKGPVVLIGDAVHGMTPGLGQGANQGLEDACELAHSLSSLLLSKEDVSTDMLADVLTTFWREHRFHRVQEIHAASSIRTKEINSSVKANTPGSKEEMQALFERIYSWKPSFVKTQVQQK